MKLSSKTPPVQVAFFYSLIQHSSKTKTSAMGASPPLLIDLQDGWLDVGASKGF
jgi:hypothetical protein